MTLRRRQRIEEVARRRQPDLTLIAEHVYKPHNLSAVIRSCDAVGIGTIHAVQPTGGVPTYSTTSASAEKWVDVVVHGDVAGAVKHVRERGLKIYAAHLSASAVDFREVDYVAPCAVLLGNEREGVSAEAAGLADEHIVIPMLGMVQSLNVSVAAAVILFEAQRQRREAGRYERPSLPSEELRALTERWLANRR